MKLNRTMPNTDHFQLVPDFFSSKEEGKTAAKENTNPRYKFFKQAHFTAGDYEQFLEFWDTSGHTKTCSPVYDQAILPVQLQDPLFRSITSQDVFATFEYLFHKFKKGIFGKFVSNDLRVFLPFSKIDFTNEWADRLEVNLNKYKDFTALFEKSCQLAGFSLDKKRVHFMKDHWYANNGLLRYEFPISENDSGISTIRDMFLCLSRERNVPDTEFFLNKRDFPILRKDGCESYDSIFGPSHPLVSHKHQKYCPVLSMTTTDEHADIPIPTWEDWARVEFQNGKFFGKEFSSFPDPFVPFSQKTFTTAVFRGSSTGLGVSLQTNPRLFFSNLSSLKKKDTDGQLFLDCGITKWNCRPRKLHPTDFYDTFDQELVQMIGSSNFLTMAEQAQYKYILHLPGHSESYRLSYELATGSVILMYPCRYKLWFSHLLQPYVHYVPVGEDIYETIRWCKQNEERCAEIARQARSFYDRYLSRDGILDYLQSILCSIQEHTGLITFPKKSMSVYQQVLQQKELEKETSLLKNYILQDLPPNWTDMDFSSLSPRSFQVLLYKYDPALILQKIEQAPIFKESRNVVLRKIQICGRWLCVKTPKSLTKNDLTHECFVGTVGGINRLANICPMIVFIYGQWGNNILLDYVEGETLEQTIANYPEKEIVSFFLTILQQLILLLSFLQTEFGFIHFDLYPWNIMICSNTTKKVFEFSLQNGETIRYCPDVFPVLIDFGKSHIVHQNHHFVNVSPFYLNFHQDLFCILLSGTHQILQHFKISYENVHRILYLFKYIAPSSYAPSIPNLVALKQFIKKKKKFSNMLLDEKKDFTFKNPLDLFFYIQKISSFPCTILPKEPDIIIKMEVFYSRFLIQKEICRVVGYGCNDLWNTFLTERLEIHTTTNSTLLSAYKELINHMIVSHIFPDKLTHCKYPALEKLLSSAPLKQVPNPPPCALSLPIYFSHPFLDRPLPILKKNQFMDRHKVFLSLLIASQQIPWFKPFGDQIKQTQKHFLYLVFHKHVSQTIHQHLQSYHAWLKTFT